MNALISGQAGVAFAIMGNNAEIVEINSGDTFRAFPAEAIWYALDHATDVRELRNVSYSDIKSQLKTDWECDRALHLTLILLSREEELGDREQAAALAGQLVASNAVHSFVQNRLYAAPMPGLADLGGAARLAATSSERLAELLVRVENKQATIRKIWNAFSKIPDAAFGDGSARLQIQAKVKGTGAARLLAEADSGISGDVIIKLLQAMSGIDNTRAVANGWVRALGVAVRVKRVMNPDEDENQSEAHRERYTHPTSGHQAFQNVSSQKTAIKAAIAKGDLSLTRKFVSELVSVQTSNKQDPGYASKSLCDLSQHAKAFNNHSLQLELAELATDVCESDGWAHSQVADAFICLGQVDNARQALERAAERGEKGYAATGRARLLRLQGKLPEALAAFEQATREFDEEPRAWQGCAEVLREMWRLDDSRRAYDEAIRRFPKDFVMLCGRANVLKELGLFEEALQEYNIVLQLAEDEPFGRDGKADVLFQWGRLNEALAQYLSNIETFPGDSVAYCGAAETLLSLGREEDALTMYDRAVAAFPHIPVPVSGRANALLVIGRLQDAEVAYREALSRFPSDLFIRNGFANLLKKRGHHSEALQLYEHISQDHLFDIVSRTARADLLKHLGQVNDAIAAYEELSRRNPRNRRIRNSLAALLVSNGEFDKAEHLLPTRAPFTEEDWVAHHVRGMLLMKRRNFAAAERLFRNGLNECPWHAELPFFKNALAACFICQDRLRPAEQLTGSDSNPIAQVLKIHIFGELGKVRMASNSYHRIDYCPPLLVPVRNELAGRYVLGLGARRSNQWVLEQMTNAVLLRAA
ncbi:MAG: hypothetical protein JWN40_96 [Phycisphaerales bacterium]|nr:hypothetical protein [Phycisphaerales bacterium]